MDKEDFKYELLKSNRKIFRIGLTLLLICGTTCALIIGFMGLTERSAIVGVCLFGLFVLIGLFMMISGLRAKGKIKSGEHELLIAINNQTNYVVWVYQHTMTTKAEFATKKHKNFSLILYTESGKRLGFMVKEESRLIEMINFLSSKFPNALVGYTEENRIAASDIIGQEIKHLPF